MKFYSLIIGELYFSRADKFKDRYEGSIPRKNFHEHLELMSYGTDKKEKDSVKKELETKFEERKRKAAISCWHINENESAAMWEIYSRAGHGIAVKTSIDKLYEIPKPDEYEIELFKVNYIDFDNEYNEAYNYYELLPFINKRYEFEHEHEFRIMLYQNGNDDYPYKDSSFSTTIRASDIVKNGFKSKLKYMAQNWFNCLPMTESMQSLLMIPCIADQEANG